MAGVGRWRFIDLLELIGWHGRDALGRLALIVGQASVAHGLLSVSR
jgi:hypothetical protein